MCPPIHFHNDFQNDLEYLDNLMVGDELEHELEVELARLDAEENDPDYDFTSEELDEMEILHTQYKYDIVMAEIEFIFG